MLGGLSYISKDRIQHEQQNEENLMSFYQTWPENAAAIGFNMSDQPRKDLPVRLLDNIGETNRTSLLRKVFETQDDKFIEETVAKYKPKVIPIVYTEEWIEGINSARAKGADVNLLKAIYLNSSDSNDSLLAAKSQALGGNGALMFIDWYHPTVQKEIQMGNGRRANTTVVNCAARLLRDSSRYNQGNISHALTGYIAGTIRMQEAMIKSGSQEYGEFRKFLNPLDRTLCDRTLVTYLALEKVIDVTEEQPQPSIITRLFGGKK